MIRIQRREIEVGKSYFFEYRTHNPTGPSTTHRGKGIVTGFRDMEGAMIPTIKPLYEFSRNGVKTEGGDDITCDHACLLYRDTAGNIKAHRDPLENDQFRLNQSMTDIKNRMALRYTQSRNPRFKMSEEAERFDVNAFAPLKYPRELYGPPVRIPRQSAPRQSASSQRAPKKSRVEGGRRRTLRRNKRR